ncbi:probable inactive receptor kinase At5g10020 [Cucurbita pepo subsp. pepo]|uniref:probable inactive receptor kinase At5g10020 n=1 Tax=Cucurbita pepo subsp. pepo TaxID=3664 RepID=UPI000C9D3145|nr:probable inactive receptor kinase At5g10020 [Cucurbita pepo subsp. pepo]
MHVTCLIICLFLLVNVLGQSDFAALLELKKGIVQDPSGLLDSWDSSSLGSNGCPSNWFGIVCADGRVISLAFDNAGLVGDFSFAAITGLSLLRNLSLSNNQFTGSIVKVGMFKSLEFLDLSQNRFRGSVPDLLIGLVNLVSLNLSSNQFDGAFPTGFSKLEELKYVDVHGNGFSGDITRLLSRMGSVEYVDLSSNRFTGSMDAGVGNPSFISSIRYLNISHNLLNGVLFPHDGMPYFDSLEVFDASNNEFVGTIPAFNFVVSLQTLRLGRNKLSGSLPEALLRESSMLLTELDLSLNQLQGPVGSITSTTLKKLNISSNKLTGSLPATVGSCAVIDLSNNMLSGNLSWIQSWGNHVEVIQLSSNSLTGTLSDKSSQFLRLTLLNVSNNSLEGVLPAVLGTYPELEVIDLSYNRLNGPVPSTLFHSVKLTDLNLSGNNFTGPMPLYESINSTSSSSLKSLDLSRNSLTGHLPSELSTFHSLVYLNLSRNYFDGIIPGNLPNSLNGFDVSFNNLSGEVPENLMRFSDSAFHPGNSLLTFPSSPSNSRDFPGLPSTMYQSRIKTILRIVLIAGLILVAALVVLFCIILYYRAQRLDHSTSTNDGKKDALEEASSVIRQSETNKKKTTSTPPSGFRQDLLPRSHRGDDHVGSNVWSVSDKAKNVGYHESLGKGEGISSPMSLMSSSNPSPTKSQLHLDTPQALNVRSPDKLAGDLHLFDGSLTFTAEELSRAPGEIVGKSCHGTLYKATLDSGHVLAVKWLREGMAKGKKEFAREVKKLGSIKHPNLVSINGYYWGPRDHEKLLISTFINAQSLAFYLQEMERGGVLPLSLPTRLKVASNIAQCLNYLHNEKAIPHGNLKSSNVLLEVRTMNARLTDYSLHRILTPAGTAEQVLNAGALGYRPPEFASSSKPCPSLNSDVYAYGVILLELITGRSSGEIVCGIPGVVDLTDWVRYLARENRFDECIDRTVLDLDGEETVPKQLEDMLQMALRCTLPAAERPDMKTVYEELSVTVQ